LEGSCIERIEERLNLNPEICNVTYDLVRRIVEDRFGFQEDSYEFYLGSDKQMKKDYASFKKFGNRWKQVPEDKSWGPIHDAWMLANTDLFIGNMASTMSYAIGIWHQSLMNGSLEYHPAPLTL
jgi:hypothetical protein